MDGWVSADCWRRTGLVMLAVASRRAWTPSSLAGSSLYASASPLELLDARSLRLLVSGLAALESCDALLVLLDVRFPSRLEALEKLAQALLGVVARAPLELLVARWGLVARRGPCPKLV